MPMPLLNAQTGKEEQVSDPEKAFLGGTHGLAKGSEVFFYNEGDEGIYSATSDKAEEFLKMGLRFATPEEVHERRMQKQYGEGLGTEARTFAEGVGRGLTFSASDAILENVFDVEEEGLRERKKRNVKAAVTGDIAGAVIPIALTGPLAGGAKAGVGVTAKVASKMPTAVMSQVATRAEKKIAEGIAKKVIKKRLATGANLAKDLSVPQKLIPKAVAGFGEGGAYGMGHLVSEASLGNTDFTAENVVSHVGFGGLMAMTTVGALGLPKEIMPKLPGVSLPPVAQSMDDLKTLFALKSTGAMKPQIKLIDKLKIAGGSKKKVAQVLEEKQIIKTGASFEGTKQRAAAAFDEAGKEIKTIIARVDEEAKKNGMELLFDDVWEEVMEKKIRPLLNHSKPSQQKMGRKLMEEYAGLVQANRGKKISLSDLIKERQETRFLARKGRDIGVAPTTFSSHLDELGYVLKTIEEREADRLSGALKLGSSYKKAKTDWQVLDWANKALDNKIESETANLLLSLTDRMAVIGGGSAGALASGTIGPSALAVGAGGGLVNRFFRTRGATIGHGILSKINSIHALHGVNTKAASKIANSVSKYLSGAKGAVVPSSTKALMNTSFSGGSPKKGQTPQQAFVRMSKELDELSQNPEKAIVMFAEATDPLTEFAPETSQKASQKMSQIATYLQEKKPKDDSPVPDVFQGEEFVPSDSELAKWARIVNASIDPDTVVDNLNSGLFSKEEADALRELWPQKFQLLVDEIINQVGDKDIKMDYKKKLELSLILDMPLTPSLMPDRVEMFQSIYQKPAQAGPGQKKQGGQKIANKKGKIDVAGRQQTELDRVNAGGIGGK